MNNFSHKIKAYIFKPLIYSFALLLVACGGSDTPVIDETKIIEEPGGSGGNDTGGNDTGGNDTGGNDTGGNDTGGNDTGGNDTGGNDTGGNDTGGNDTGGNDTGGNDTGGNDTGGNDTGGNDTGGNDTGGSGTGGNASVISGQHTATITAGSIDDTTNATGTLSITDVDEGDDPTFEDQASTAGDNGFGSFVLVSGTWTYTLDQSSVQNFGAGTSSTDTITYNATDGSSQLISVIINGSDDDSVISGNFSGVVTEGEVNDIITTTGTLSISDIDTNNTPVFNNQSSTLGTNRWGNFTLVDGTWTYTLDSSSAQILNAGDIETDTITFTASDSNTQEVTITINGSGGTTSSVRLNNSTCIANETIDPDSEGLNFNKAFSSLEVITALMSLSQPESDSSMWFGVERAGRIISFNNTPDATTVNEVLDLTSQVSTDGEMGLTGLAIHPNYPADNRIFILYNDDNNSGRSTISSLEVNTTTRKASNEQVLLTLEQPNNNHNGGDMHFGPDGYLYAAFGDGGGNAGRSIAQLLTNLLGAMIRIDVSPSTGYNIPEDNPYYDSNNLAQVQCSTGSSTENCPEIFAHGLRNPWRWSFDSENGDIWVGDVGDSDWEEINRIEKGLNYGWPIMEGPACAPDTSCDTSPYEAPIAAYGRDIGPSIAGGYVYRGVINAELIGQYIANDLYWANTITVPSNAEKGSDYEILTLVRNKGFAAFAQDNNGEIYGLDFGADTPGDAIYRLEGGQALIGMSESLNDTGCFNTETKQAADGVVDFEVNSALWSDGAAKERQFALPDGEEITVLADGDFDFPEGSVLIKHFLHGGDYLETRLLVNHDSGWRGYSYEWNDEQTDATLLTEGKTKDIGDYTHIYPSSGQCFTCHTSAASISLGIEAKQLNYFNETEDKSMLMALSQAGYLSEDLSDNTDTLFSINDVKATTDEKARSYLHSNCSGCHRPGGNADFMNLSYDTALSEMGICNVVATNGDMGLTDPNRVTPGDADNSILLARMKSVDGNRMPPLGTLEEDTEATALIEAWINSLSTCP